MRFKLALILCCLLAAANAFSAEPEPQGTQALTVGLAECPPFVMFENGKPAGLAVYLWENVGKELGLQWTYTEYSLGELLSMVTSGSQSDLPDVAISCSSVTAEREQLIDFSHSFHETYTAIAVKESTLWAVVTEFFAHPRVVKAFLAVLGLAALIGLVFYLLEGRINKKMFSTPTGPGRILEPLFIGLMFVSSGPIRFYRFKTLSARFLATMLTLSSTFLIAAVTAVLASSFTLDAMQTDVNSLEDLRNLQVASLEGSTSSALLDMHGIVHQTYTDLVSMVDDLDAGKVDAVVSDASFLKYRISQGNRKGQYKNLTVLPNKLGPQNYAFILKENSPYREGINRALLSVRIQDAWRSKIKHYIGE